MSELDTFKSAFAEELDVDPDELVPEARLDSFENWDSVMALTAVVLIEQACGSRVSPEQMESLETYGDMEELIRSRLAG